MSETGAGVGLDDSTTAVVASSSESRNRGVEEEGNEDGDPSVENPPAFSLDDIDTRTRPDVDNATELLTEEDRVKRLWKIVVTDIQFRSLKKSMSPYIRFTIGGDYRIEDRRHLGGKKGAVGKRGKTFRTSRVKNQGSGSGGTFPNEFTRYWTGSYDDLETQDLIIELWHFRFLCPNQRKGEVRKKLIKVVDGDVFQRIEVKGVEDNSKVTMVILEFKLFFQEMHTFEMSFDDWNGRDIVPVDNLQSEHPTSDPYVKLRIPRDFWKLFHSGGYFGRSCVSKVCRETTDPEWDTLGKLKFYGTLGELENEDVFVEVWDHSFGFDKKIGERILPLRGVVDSQGLFCRLVFDDGEKRIPGGVIQGSVNFASCPRYMQQGDFVTLKPYHKYLCLNIQSCSDLPAMAATLYSDPFVIVRYDGVSFRTKTVPENLNPRFDQKIFIPIFFVDMSKEEILSKGPIEIEVYHEDEHGNDKIGATYLNVSQILRSNKFAYFEGTVWGEKKTHMYRGTLPLSNPFLPNGAQRITVEAYFAPDIGKHIEFTDEDDNLDIDFSDKLDPLIVQRERVWRREILEAGIDPSRFFISRKDERLKERFLSSFLQIPELTIPRDHRDEKIIARMINCLTWDEDSSIYGGADNVWTSPEFFQNIRKGDSEDHAILMGNLFLGLEKYHQTNVYLCVGETHDGREHTWLMTRESDGSVIFWETTTAKRYKLPDRWVGESLPEDLLMEIHDLGLSSNPGKETVASISDVDLIELPGDLYLGLDDIMNDMLDEDNELVGRAVAKIARKRNNDDGMSIGTSVIGDLEPVLIPYGKIFLVFNNMNLWANVQHLHPGVIRYDFEENSMWIPFVPDDEEWSHLREVIRPFYREVPMLPRMPIYRVRAIENRILREMRLAYAVWRNKYHMKTHFLDSLRPILVRGLQIRENLKTITVDELAELRLNLRLLQEEFSSTPFDEEQKRDNLIAKMKELRQELADYDLDMWRGMLNQNVPAGHDFRGACGCFAYYNPIRIRKWFMKRYKYHEEKDKESKFAMAVYARPYRNHSLAVWVYCAVIKPVPIGEEIYEE